MKIRYGLIVSLIFLFVIAGCGGSGEPASGSADKEDEQTSNKPEKEEEKIPDFSDEYLVGNIDLYGDPDYDPESTYRYYSDDGSVYIKQNPVTCKSVIVDGDIEIPVEIATGVYGPRILKTDVDSDGEDEYVIAECEGTGTGFSVYGLCVVKYTGTQYEMALFDGKYFAGVIIDNIEYSYDAKKHEVTFTVKDGDAEPYSVVLERDASLEDIEWRNIIRIEFRNDMPYLSVPSGYVFTDSPVPDYEQAVEVSAPIWLNEKGEIFIGDFSFGEEDG